MHSLMNDSMLMPSQIVKSMIEHLLEIILSVSQMASLFLSGCKGKGTVTEVCKSLFVGFKSDFDSLL